MIFEWKKEYLVGVESIDIQHQKIFMMSKVLHGYIEAGESHLVMKNFLKELVKYTKSHFADEELVMREHNLPSGFYAIEVDEHFRLIEQLHELQEEFEKQKSLFTPKVTNFLINWLKNHILRTDYKIGEYINGEKKQAAQKAKEELKKEVDAEPK